MNGFREDFPVRNWITSQFISHNLPWLTLVTLLQSLEEALGSSTVSSGLEIDIYNFPVLINRTPEVVLLAIDFNEDLVNIVNIEGIAISLMASFQSLGIFRTELDHPESDRLVADDNPAFCQ